MRACFLTFCSATYDFLDYPLTTFSFRSPSFQVVKKTGLRSVSAPSQESSSAPIRIKFNVGKPVSANVSGGRGKSTTPTSARQTSLAVLAHKNSGTRVASPYWASGNRAAGGDKGEPEKHEGRSMRSRSNGTQ